MDTTQLEDRVKEVISANPEGEYLLVAGLLHVAFLFAQIRYGAQCPNLEKYQAYQTNAVKIKRRLRDVMERAGILFDDQGSIRDEANFQAIIISHVDNLYQFEFDALDVFTIHGLLRLSEIYPEDYEYKDPMSRAIMLGRFREWCHFCFLEMGFTAEEAQALDTATIEDERLQDGREGHTGTTPKL